MNFDFSDDQKALRGEARKFLDARGGRGIARCAMHASDSFDRLELWKEVASLGWLGLSIPERFGGAGLGRTELCVLAEEIGRVVSPMPFSSTLYFFAEALLMAGTDEQRARWLGSIPGGDAIGCFAVSERPGTPTARAITTVYREGKVHGLKLPVTDGDVANVAIVAARDGDGISLILVPLTQSAVKRKVVKTIDPSRGHTSIEFDGAEGERLGVSGEGWRLADAVLDRAAVYLAFEQIGGADACLAMATEYASTRYAFSRPIGSFQAIKHKLADMFVGNQLARSNAYYGAWALDADGAELPRAAAAARIAATQAYWYAAKENIQTHGGIGFTWDIDCHFFYRRAKLLAVQAGPVGLWRERLVTQLTQNLTK